MTWEESSFKFKMFFFFFPVVMSQVFDCCERFQTSLKTVHACYSALVSYTISEFRVCIFPLSSLYHYVPLYKQTPGKPAPDIVHTFSYGEVFLCISVGTCWVRSLSPPCPAEIWHKEQNIFFFFFLSHCKLAYAFFAGLSTILFFLQDLVHLPVYNIRV